MDLEIKVKEEPIFFEETSITSCDNYKIISEEMHLKEEPKSELAVPRETQPSSDIKNEVTVDEHTVGQLVACFKEEDKFVNGALLNGGPVGTCNSRCKVLKEGSELKCILSTHNGCNIHMFSDTVPFSQQALRCADLIFATNLRRSQDYHDAKNSGKSQMWVETQLIVGLRNIGPCAL
ncbi:uncharacterized protein [Anabrus simplex]|uniref:uncharacterized protein n=1 Tax=Anabrus simplex TaxID=316456 RepID=UPI0035A3A341